MIDQEALWSRIRELQVQVKERCTWVSQELFMAEVREVERWKKEANDRMEAGFGSDAAKTERASAEHYCKLWKEVNGLLEGEKKDKAHLLESKNEHIQLLQEALEDAVGIRTMAPVWDVLERLADTADILLHTHSYDGLGHEGISLTRDAARELATVIRNAYHVVLCGKDQDAK